MKAPGLFPTGPCPARGSLWSDGRCLPNAILHPTGVFGMEVAVPVLSAIMLVFIVRKCLRARSLTWSFLLAVASASTFWLETFGDWAQHLLYTPYLHHYTVPIQQSAPHNPVVMPLTYAIYWWAHAWVILRLASWGRQRFPKIGMGTAILSLSAPVTFLWNLIVEGTTTYFGIWTYDPPIGPAIHWPNGAYWPLLWPVMLMMGWINLIAWMVRLPEEQHEPNGIERLFKLDKLLSNPGWTRGGNNTSDMQAGNVRFQLLRLAVWIAFFNVTFALALNLPLYFMRVLGGFGSVWLP